MSDECREIKHEISQLRNTLCDMIKTLAKLDVRTEILKELALNQCNESQRAVVSVLEKLLVRGKE